MALDELLRSLEEAAEARRTALLADAQADAERVRTDRAADLARRVAADRGARELELRRTATRAVDAARRHATGEVLKARAEALDRIRQRAESSLAERAADRTALPRLARDLALALEYLGTAPAIVEAPASLLDDLRRTLSDASRVTLVPSSGRMIARSADGAVEVDASMERRFARAWPRLAIELSARLEALS